MNLPFNILKKNFKTPILIVAILLLFKTSYSNENEHKLSEEVIKNIKTNRKLNKKDQKEGIENLFPKRRRKIAKGIINDTYYNEFEKKLNIITNNDDENYGCNSDIQPEIFKSIIESSQEIIKKRMAEKLDGLNALEIGGGNGNRSILYSLIGFSKIYYNDLSEEETKEFKENIEILFKGSKKSEKLLKRIKTLQGDISEEIETLVNEGLKFDVILLNHVIPYLDKKKEEKLFKGIKKILSKNGVIHISFSGKVFNKNYDGKTFSIKESLDFKQKSEDEWTYSKQKLSYHKESNKNLLKEDKEILFQELIEKGKIEAKTKKIKKRKNKTEKDRKREAMKIIICESLRKMERNVKINYRKIHNEDIFSKYGNDCVEKIKNELLKTIEPDENGNIVYEVLISTETSRVFSKKDINKLLEDYGLQKIFFGIQDKKGYLRRKADETKLDFRHIIATHKDINKNS